MDLPADSMLAYGHHGWPMASAARPVASRRWHRIDNGIDKEGIKRWLITIKIVLIFN